MGTWHNDFLLGDWRISPKLNKISHNDQSKTLKHKSMAVLVCLADANGELLTRNEILDTVWPGLAVTDDVLTQSIVELRKAFEDDAKHPKFIETVPKVGFRLIAEIQEADTAVSTNSSRRSLYARTSLLAGLLLVAVWAWNNLLPDPRNRIIPFDAPTSIAVLPFVNMSSDPENEYFAEGLSEEIRNLLARVDNIKVIGRTSSHAIVEESLSSAEIGERLGVTILLEGSVRKYEDRVRISAQLVRADDGTSIWSDSYDQIVDDVFRLQDDVAASVLNALQIHVSMRPKRRNPTEFPDAYSLYLKARSATHALDFVAAERMLLQATALDPSFAEAYEELAFVYYAMAGTLISATEAQVLISDVAREALILDPNLAYAKVMFAATQLGPDYRRGSVKVVGDALRSYPNDPKLLEMQVWLLTEFGYLIEATKFVEQFLKVEPLSLYAQAYGSAIMYATGDTVAAMQMLLITDDEIPNLSRSTWTSFGILIAEKRYDLAKTTLATWLQERGVNVPALAVDLIKNSSDPATGAAYLDSIIPDLLERLKSDDSFPWQDEVISLYLFFGHLDRYYELLMATNPSDKTWHYAGIHAWHAVVMRKLGSTGHPEFRNLARMLSIDDVWEDRGAPDFCEKVSGDWVCE